MNFFFKFAHNSIDCSAEISYEEIFLRLFVSFFSHLFTINSYQLSF